MLKKVFVQNKIRNSLTVPKTVEQCPENLIPYLNTLNRTIPVVYKLEFDVKSRRCSVHLEFDAKDAKRRRRKKKN